MTATKKPPKELRQRLAWDIKKREFADGKKDRKKR